MNQLITGGAALMSTNHRKKWECLCTYHIFAELQDDYCIANKKIGKLSKKMMINRLVEGKCSGNHACKPHNWWILMGFCCTFPQMGLVDENNDGGIKGDIQTWYDQLYTMCFCLKTMWKPSNSLVQHHFPYYHDASKWPCGEYARFIGLTQTWRSA